MTSTQLDTQFRKLGYFLIRRSNVDGAYWFVGSQQTHNGWNCSNLVEAKSLLGALRDKAENGGQIIHDGSEWVCVEVA
ncbi:MAG TPA: hypothetical protein PKD53_27235 [Chloroflexaceae bacterium]|nr:hypothetical protein [Chloroflexaceae bacterium]